MVTLRSSFSAIIIVVLCLLMTLSISGVRAFQSPTPRMHPLKPADEVVGSSRKAFLASAAAAAVVAVAAPAHADEYDDARAAKRAKAAESNGSVALAVPLIGGLALSLPFFLPNILRLLGVKNSKMK